MALVSGTAPQSVLLFRPDGMGDIILFEPVLRALRKAWPKARLAVVVQEPYVELGRLLAPSVEWLGTRLDPFRAGPEGDPVELERIRGVVRAMAPEIVVACTFRRNWLDGALASAAPTARRVVFGDGSEDPYFGAQLRALYGNDAVRVDAVAAPGEGEQDWRRAFGLVRALGVSAAPDFPAVSEHTAWQDQADPLLRAWGWEKGRYAVCAAAGFANVPIKTWPRERFVAALRQAAIGPAVLVGSRGEREYLEPAAAELQGRVWTGGGDDWRQLAALVRHAAVCVGSDTGLLHLAAAVGTPVVGIYGGGTWPRFVPAGPGVALVNPLPCFGCGWDCAFGNAPCIGAISVDDVANALRQAAGTRGEGECAVRAVQHLSDETREIMGAAAEQFRERGALLRARERRFQETVRLAGEKDGEIEALKRETDGKDAEIAQLKRETDGKDAEIAALKIATDERAELIRRLDATCRDRELVIRDLKFAADRNRELAEASSAEADAMRREAELRLQEIVTLQRACEELRSALAGRRAD
jgi:ADP-heptose:LPS heptosyltransferase